MIVIATGIIGGPGKGVFQFLKFADHSRFDYLLCNYDRAGMTGFRDDFLEKATADDIPVHRFYQRMVVDPLIVLQACKTIKQQRINIVQTHSYKSNILGCVLKMFFGIPWIAFAHGYTGENRKIALYNWLDQWCYKFADLAVVVSEPLKRLLLTKGVQLHRIVKLPNAVDLAELAQHTLPDALRQDLGLREEVPVIGVIGRLSPEKGQMVFLEALRRIKARHGSVRALIIGDGPAKARLMDYCRAQNLADDVIFTGHVPNVSDYYRLLDLRCDPIVQRRTAQCVAGVHGRGRAGGVDLRGGRGRSAGGYAGQYGACGRCRGHG